MLQVLLLYLLFGSIFTVEKLALGHSEPFFLLGSRMLIAGIILLTYIFFKKPKSFSLVKKEKKLFFALSFFNIYMCNSLEFLGLQHLSSSKTCFIYSLSPFFSALLAYFIFKEKLTPKKWIGLVIGFIGLIPILYSPSNTDEARFAEFLIFSWPELCVIMAVAAGAYGWVILSQLINKGASPLLANGVSMLIGGIFALVHSFCVEPWNPVPVFGDFKIFIGSALWMVVVSSLICYNLYGHLLRSYTVTFMSFAGFTTPFFTALFAWFTLNETVSTPFFLSSLIVFCGLCFFYLEELRKEGIRK